ncbi:Something about silencing protein 10 [Sergentomyia squamirostris]
MSDKILIDRHGTGDGYGISDSDDEYSSKERQLLKKYRDAQASASESDEEEVFGLPQDDSMSNDSDFDDETAKEKIEADSDVMSEDEDGIPDDRAWGNKKSAFYNTDFVDQDYDAYTAREEELAQLEEQETRKLQQRLTKQLSEAQFSLDIFSKVEGETSKKRVKINKEESSTASKQQEIAQFQKESPEFDALVDELLSKLEETQDVLQPFLEELRKHNLSEIPIYEFIDTRNKLCLHYATNLTFYLMLKHKKIPVKNHPVMKRIVQFRELLQQMEEKFQGEAQTEMEKILLDIQSGNIIALPKSKLEKKPRKMLNILKEVSKAQEIFQDSDQDSRESQEEDNEIDENPSEGDKRAITYQMAKNKGLMPNRKKEVRNPRVKHRMKFKKALVRRKGAVRTVRKEDKRYTGEHSGIKSTVRKSIKIR